MTKILSVVAAVLLIGGLIWLIKPEKKELTSVGFLFPDSMYDQTWGTEGYKGMLDIVQTYDTALFYEQNINTRVKTEKAIKEMAARKVNILFGQGREFSEAFNDLAAQYPDVNFVVFNGTSKAENVTAVNIDGYSMGFFSGMIAGHQTDSNRIGVIGAYNTQPDIKGFIDGAQYENPKVKIVADYIGTFGYDSRGEVLADRMIKDDHVDVLFPAADGVNAAIMTLMKEQDVSSIGYIIDQSSYGPQVLTSLQLNLAKAYADVADRYTKNQLKGGIYYFGVKEGMVQLGEFSYRVDPEFQQQISEQLNRYKNEQVLPNGRKESKDYFKFYLKADQ